MRIAVLGDMHANATALVAGLATADSGGYDMLVLLGDLLTYGADVAETLELVGERLADPHTLLLRGNHDALYEELLVGRSAYGDHFPEWIIESVLWTIERLPVARWRALRFEDEQEVEGVLFSHANPFGARCWDYLNSEADHARAATALGGRAMVAGVFGHTHRLRWYRHAVARGAFVPNTQGELDRKAVHVLNAGAIGQPRDVTDPSPHVLWLTMPDGAGPTGPCTFRMQRFGYDIAEHLRRVSDSGMTEATVARLVGFFADHGQIRPHVT